jgi:hypothetical protein
MPIDDQPVTVLSGRLAAIEVNLAALQRLIDEREARTKERFQALKESTENGMNSAKEAITAAMDASDKAVNKSEVATEKRFESVNEFRKSLSDQTANQLTRAEYQIAHQSILDKIDMCEKRMSAMHVDISSLQERSTTTKEITKDTSARTYSLLAIGVAAAVGIGQFISSMSLHNEQTELSRSVAKNPVEGRDLDVVTRQIAELARRLDDLAKAKP